MNGRMAGGLLRFGLAVSIFALLSCGGPGGLRRMPDTSKLDATNWYELRSPDFTIYGRGSEAKLEAFATDLARFIAATERLVRSEPPKTTALIVLIDLEAASLFIPSSNVEAFMGGRLDGFYGVVRASDHDPIRRHVFLHEYSHYLNQRNSRLGYPKWYVEGFAEFLGSIRTRDDVVEIGSAPPWRIYQLQTMDAYDQGMDLEEIFAHESNGRSAEPTAFYARSWAVVHYMNSTAENRERLKSMLALQASGLDWTIAYSRSFPVPLEILSKQVARHVEYLSSGAVDAIAYLPLETLPVRSDWTLRAVPEVEILQILGEMAARGSTWSGRAHSERLAEVLFERSLAVDPENARSHADLADLFTRQKRTHEATSHLASFDRDPSPSFEALLGAARAVQRLALRSRSAEPDDPQKTTHASAIALFRRALELRPTDPLALAGLGRSQLAEENFDLARQSLAAAQENGEWDADLTLDRGRVEARSGNPDGARRYWIEVRRLGTTKEAKRAQSLLDGLEEGQ